MPVRYLVVVEQSATGFGAYVPDLPGCVAIAETRDEALQLIREGIGVHIETLREAGEPIPPPTTHGELVEINAA